jgi:pyruvyltransferase
MIRLARSKLLFDSAKTLAVWRGRAVRAYWSSHSETRRNFGDAINPAVIEYLTGLPAVHSDDVLYLLPRPTLYCIGSILDNLSEGQPVIAGAGFKWESARIYRKPSQVIAVRGPLTRDKLLTRGVDCPQLYCDPGLLVPRLFPKVQGPPAYDFGIVPHYMDADALRATKMESGGMSVRVIDIEAPPTEVAAAIQSCARIASSSLHGIITAHAYGIPAAWIHMSDRVGGEGFKFRDYYGSLGIEDARPYDARAGIDLKALEPLCVAPEVEPMVERFVEAFRSGFPRAR